MLETAEGNLGVLERERASMITIRLPKRQWGKAWRAMIEIGPVRMIAQDPIYEVLPDHLKLLEEKGFSYEIVHPQPPGKERRRHGTAD
jgi:hypothetical protein